MSSINLCRLCVSLCGRDSKSLYDKSGKQNETYEITLKYFHPMFLNVDHGTDCTVLCARCWQHISSFYDFQETVFEAQRKLLADETVINLQTEKLNVGSVPDDSTHFSEFDINSSDYSISLPDLELIEDSSSGDNIKYSEDTKDSINKNLTLESNETEVTSTFSPSAAATGSSNRLNKNYYRLNSKRKRRNKSELDKTIAKWRPILTCEVCAESVTSFTLLQNHFAAVHSEEPCYVSCCGLKFTYRYKFEEHAVWHLDENAFCCKICGACLGSRARLNMHTRENHPLSRMKPNVIRKKRIKRTYYGKTSGAQLDAFIAQFMPKMQCYLCHETQPSLTLLKIHFSEHHAGAECYVLCCQRKFSDRSKLKEHIQVHLDPDVFKCMECGKRISSLMNLKSHHVRVHKRQQNTNVPKTLNTSKNLRNKKTRRDYDKLISQWKPNLECYICNEKYLTFTGIQVHFRKKHTIKQFQIQCCEQKFNRRPAFVGHLRLHNNPDAYRCLECDITYTLQKSYLNHIRIHHPEKNINELFG